MMKYYVLLALILLAACSKNNKGTRMGVVSFTPCALRSAASVSSPALRALKMHETVEPLSAITAGDDGNQFVQVKAGEETGWVLAQNIQIDAGLGVTIKECAWRKSPNDNPEGFLPRANLVYVPLKVSNAPGFTLVRVKDGKKWISYHVLSADISQSANDTDIFSKVLPSVQEYIKKGMNAPTPEAKVDQFKLARLFVSDAKIKYAASPLADYLEQAAVVVEDAAARASGAEIPAEETAE